MPTDVFGFFKLGPLNGLLLQFETAATTWPGILIPIGLRLFGFLAAIEMTWTAIQCVLDSSETDLARFVRVLLRKVLHFGFAFAMIFLAPFAMKLIVQGFSAAALSVPVITPGLRPTDFLNRGIDTVFAIAQILFPSGILGYFSIGSVFSVICLLFIGLSFAFMAGILVVTLAETWLLLGIGPFFFAFAGSRWTYALTEGFVSLIVRNAVKLFVLILFSNFILTYASQLQNAIASWTMLDPKQLMSMTATCVIAASIMFAAPRLAAGLLPTHIHFGFNPKTGDH